MTKAELKKHEATEKRLANKQVKKRSKKTAAVKLNLRSPEKNEDLIGAHVVMSFRRKELLGTVEAEDERNGIQFLTVRFFNGEYWPVSPARFEVGVCS